MTRSESRRGSGYGGGHESVVASGKPDWPAIWYAKLRRHHQIAQRERWEFDGEHVVAYLMRGNAEDMAISKRLKVAEALLEFRRWKRWKECPLLDKVCETPRNAKRAQQKGGPRMLKGNLGTPESHLEGVPSYEFSSICRCIRSLMG
ncbi:hypothetical protein Pla52n_52660 [Stieleria varia]|uniref:Uncharacterized protein n=1 Tax=Stieleria varia TaxID=2528005 RepID=A0A5C6A4Y3_9BACT|nr:hypothetical protein Pla52n_52660 [Stieleria varia]